MQHTDAITADQLVKEHYGALKAIASAKRRGNRESDMLLTTDILHETWLKLRNHAEWKDESHFFRTCALAMRQVIIDAARHRTRDKRGGGADLDFYDWKDVLPDFSETPEEIVNIGGLLLRLEAEAPDLVEVVDLRYFGGFTEKESAQIIGVTERTVRRKWKLAKAWLAARLN